MIATAERIKTLRENFGLSQAELAGRLDITRSSVNAWEMGISVPSTQYIVELAQLFGVSTDFILCVPNERRTRLPVLKKRKNRHFRDGFPLVGLAGLEPTTSRV